MIEINNLSKEYLQKVDQGFIKNTFSPKYDSFHALSDISLSIGEGEFCGILGKNGAGKSTFIKLLCGLQTPSSGNVSILGKQADKHESELFHKIAVIFGQKSSLWWDLPLSDSINATKFIYNLDNDEFEERKKYIINALALDDVLSRPVRVLSLGERVKGELAFNLMHKPKVILLDEPTIGLDVVSKARLRDFLKELVTLEKVTVILTSHDTSDIEYCCNRICIINEGSVKFDGQIEDFKNIISLDSMLSINFSNNDINFNEIEKIKNERGITKVSWCDKEYKTHITYTPSSISSAQVMNLIHSLDLSSSNYSIIESQPSFEDAILANFGGK